MTKTTRRNYSKEFKIEAAKLVCEQGFSVSKLPVNPTWLTRNQPLGDGLRAIPANGAPGERPRSELEAELRRLRAENEELKQQEDILKRPM